MNQQTLRVAVVDDDDAVRDSMRWLLDANGFATCGFESGEAFLAALPMNDLGCLVLDVRMPGMSGIALHEELLARGVSVPVVFITGHGDVPMAVERMKQGAADFLEKPFNDTQLCELVGQCIRRASADAQLHASQRYSRARLDRLSQRERQVLDLIVAGRLNKQIADDLSISIKTVEAHRANLMGKLGARTMADLMRIALDGAAPAGG